MEIKEDRYITTNPNPKNKKAKIFIYDQKTQKYLTLEDAIAKILNILEN